jgi:hypothetical protein
MTTHTLYNAPAGPAGPAGTGRLVITAKPGLGPCRGQWVVQFTRWRRSYKSLDRTAAWLPTLEAWDQFRWHPIGSRLIPPAVLADVETWLRGRPVGELETTTTTEAK